MDRIPLRMNLMGGNKDIHATMHKSISKTPKMLALLNKGDFKVGNERKDNL